MITEKILETTKYVVENSKHVKINEDKIKLIAPSINNLVDKNWLESAPEFLQVLPTNKLIDFILVMHAIGFFSYWGNPKWQIEYNGNVYDGSYAMIISLLRALENGINILDYNYLSNMSKDEFAAILKGNVEIPLFNERYSFVKNLSEVIINKFNSDFYTVAKYTTIDNELLDIVINNFSCFDDVSTYKGKKVYFYKKAQLLVADLLYVLNKKENIKVDITHLTAVADYKIPQVLRYLGILEYSEELSDLIDNNIELEKGSEYEIEIRANMIWAIEITKKYVNKSSKVISDLFWIKGQELKNNKDVKPYHRVRTTEY